LQTEVESDRPISMANHIGKYLFMTIGIAVLAVGIVLTIEARLGLASWSVLHKAIEELTPLTFGQVTQGVGLILIAVGWALGVLPKLGTFLNIILVGWFIDFLQAYVIATPDSLVFRAAFLVGGVAIMGFGVGMYLSANVGAGPRDTLMLALAKRLPWSIGRLRSTMELSVMALGWILGGPVGIGTVVGSVLMGPAVQASLYTFRHLEGYPLLGNIIDVPVGRRTTTRVGSVKP